MSVNFWCPDAPRQQVPCRFCQDWRLKGWIAEGERCDQWCNGFTDESVAPVANFANANAAALLSLMGFEGDALCYGSCQPAILRQKLLRARNKDRSDLVVDPSVTPGGWAGVKVIKDEDGIPTIQRMGPTIIGCGNTDEQTIRRLDDLETLAVWAQEHGQEIHWG